MHAPTTSIDSSLAAVAPQLSRRRLLGTALLTFGAAAFTKMSPTIVGVTAPSWRLADIYPDVAAWNAARVDVLGHLEQLRAPRSLASSSALLDVMQLKSSLGRSAERVETYAHLDADADHRNTAAQARAELANALSAEFDSASAWIDPAILRLGQDRIALYLSQSSELRTRFSHDLDDTLRLRQHTLSEQGEALLAGATEPLATYEAVQQQLVSSDIDWPTINLASGSRVRLDLQGLDSVRRAPDRSERRQAFDDHYTKLSGFQDALGVNYLGHIQADIFTAHARRYPSALAKALDADNMPEAVYAQLVSNAQDGIPQVHRYMVLRRKVLGLPQLGYWDLSVPFLPSGRSFTLQDMRGLTLQAVRPLGHDYVALLKSATAEDWMDPFPRPGKQVGAYMEPGVSYDVHPYLLLNLTPDYSGLSTYAHEWGHAMHTLLANAAQPYDKAQYTNSISEVPSTLNEILLVDMMIGQSRSKSDTLVYLGYLIGLLYNTYYRQVMLAEFELTAHQKVEAGDGVSGAALSKTYLDLVRKYHGPNVVIPDAYGSAWAEIPHFFNSFYVYKYATCIAAAAAFATQVRQGTEQRDRYLDALRAGGSDYPYLILRNAGVDLATPKPYAAVNDLMRNLLDRCERLLV